jgi:multidrug resistance efflux pump
VPQPDRFIPTPLFVRWQRLHRRLIPVLAVLLGTGAAWRLWREAPRITAVGQVDIETVEIRSPVGGEETEPSDAVHHTPRLYDSVAAGQVLVRVKKADGQMVEITSPIGGQIVKTNVKLGEPVTNGERLFELASDHGVSITTYIRSDQPMRPAPGMEVDIRERSDAADSLRAVIERVGPQYEPIPPAQLRDRKTEEWGLPVIITLPADANLKPGELVYVGWLPNATVSGG